MKQLKKEILPKWVPEVGTTIEISSTEVGKCIPDTDMYNWRARVIATGKAKLDGRYLIRIEGYPYEIALDKERDSAKLLGFTNIFLNVAF